MSRWTIEQAANWYAMQPWLVGCNFLPSSAINQLEMFQADSYDPETISRELWWAEDLGFNTIRVYLHDLLWAQDEGGFCERLNDFLGIADRHGMRVLFTLFDDCHRPDPALGVQPLPVPGVHNSGWKHSPGQKLTLAFHDGTVTDAERSRLKRYVQGLLKHFDGDERVLMWDLYNEPGRSENFDQSYELLTETWMWAQEVRPSQPLTSCLEGSVGEHNISLNAARSDVLTFHCYICKDLEKIIEETRAMSPGRPVICTEYMAREYGTTFQHSLPIFKKHGIGCYNWGLVAGKSQTHFNWKSVGLMEELKKQGAVLKPGDPIPEPELWFHDIFRVNGTPFDPEEVQFIKAINQEINPAVMAGR